MTGISGVLKNIKIDEKIKRARAERYACQSVARLAVPGERVSICLRNKLGNDVAVWKHKETKKAFYNGLMVCGSVWACPVCAAKISEKRRLELQQAFNLHKEKGGHIALLTLTFSHKKTDRLKDTMQRFSLATNKMFTGKAYHNIRLEMGIIGRIRVAEVTYGQNGFHPHLHIAIFYENETDLVAMKARMYKLWSKACEKFGLTSNKKYGLDLQSAEHAEEYLSKHGTWSLEQEMSKAHIKVAKNESMTPFDFLRNYLIDEDKKHLKLFREYLECFKGKRQIQWSQGLKKHFNITDKSDDELAAEKIEEADILGMLSADEWKLILKHDLRAKVLDYTEQYGFFDGMRLLMRRIKVDSDNKKVIDFGLNEVSEQQKKSIETLGETIDH